MAFWMPLIILGLATLNGILALNGFKQHQTWSHPAVKARLRVTGIMFLVSLFLFVYL
ncbi:MAG: hypothetical protein ABW139_03525 [Candidatus Thiodiazotropha sp. DIVDIV]